MSPSIGILGIAIAAALTLSWIFVYKLGKAAGQMDAIPDIKKAYNNGYQAGQIQGHMDASFDAKPYQVWE